MNEAPDEGFVRIRDELGETSHSAAITQIYIIRRQINNSIV